MPRLTLGLGLILVAVGVITYVIVGASSVTALIPAFVGLPLVLLGLLARRENLRKHAIHAALVVALIGALGSLRNVVAIGALFAGTAANPAAVIESLIMFVLCVAFVIVGVRSFIAARRARTA